MVMDRIPGVETRPELSQPRASSAPYLRVKPDALGEYYLKYVYLLYETGEGMLVTVFVPRPIYYVHHHAEVGFGAMEILLRRMGSATIYW